MDSTLDPELSALALAACGTDVAQTAVLQPLGPLDCSQPGALALPSDARFGDGTEQPSSWVGEGYEGEQGPGLFVAARDAYRVYLNGDLVVQSVAPRVATFVPLTLLPGDNALSVVVSAKSGTPAAVLQLDELEQSYPTDTSWKVSRAPNAELAGFALGPRRGVAVSSERYYSVRRFSP